MLMPYLMLGYAAAALLLLVGVEVCSRAVPGLRGVRILRWAMISAVVGVLLLALRSHAPNWISILCANAAIYACILLIYWATAEALDARARFLPWGGGLILAALGGQAFYVYAHDNLLARVLISSTAMAIVAGATAALLFRYEEPVEEWAQSGWSLRAQTRALAWLQVANGLDHVARLVLSVVYPPASYVHMDVIQAGFTYVNMLLNVAASCGVIWLALSVHRRGLQKAAGTDGLTGLLNRRAFEEILARDLRRANRDGRTLPVLLLDIDHFKAVNDSLGHQAGDQVIQRVADALRDCMRPSDVLCRFGGEEFVMLLNGATLDQADEIARRLRTEIMLLTRLPGGLRLTASLGVATSRAGELPEELLKRCDEALYRSKRAGRNRVTVDGMLSAGMRGKPEELIPWRALSPSGTDSARPR
ncbi:GGDEF domain-containing protein [Occallatibacter riparius]|uniref:diguanylate cyclase n=1 Tax=Occallatibacter riparius TaxID=1002689 RepID=A0A9J7BNJ8_9BACT|nr:GGDEF domain-containing protein [Occallatibacter riparius]UWZ84299.1 GGDEF domain-containing protein [Occallatibacter riparius]